MVQQSTAPVIGGPADFSGMVHAHAGTLVDGSGRPRLLRGMGLGNWFLAEGYMWLLEPGASSPREIEALIERLAGADYAASFWTRYRDIYITEADIARMAECGFDHVRLPINSRVIQTPTGEPIEEGYALIDRLIDWCKRHGLWVLLDLHGAPGGQTGANIDDSPNNLPELFLDQKYEDLTVRLWIDLARRYANETTVLGYDLLNEPLPNEWQHSHGDALARVYQRLTEEIRRVDADHLLVYEGSHWATNWSMFDRVWDENSCLQFHKYWSAPDRETLSEFLQTRERLNLPIYMGEGGENTLPWLYTAFRLYETEDAGWCFWPWKKLSTKTSPSNVTPPAGWDKIIASSTGETHVDPAEAQAIFDQLLKNVALDNTVWQPQVIDALMGSPLPVLPAWGFSFAGPGVGHSVAKSAEAPVFRASDRVGIRFQGESVENPFTQTDGRPYLPEEVLVIDLEPGDWLAFDVPAGFDPTGAYGVDGEGNTVPVEIAMRDARLRVTAVEHVVLAAVHFKEAM
ncbi:MAG: glycoside hydrolase family 5 protein [Propionibacteriaceae bacterium]|jgi:aryl-phospho-beta-D-glucosidase BglC (GH1 family)|nr:glycoside hydrolase family 5 protein [Propionibacteriaceae bacterium]